MDEHERLRELVGAHALRSLPLEEVREVVEHLPACPSCRELLAELETLAGELALAAPPVAPPRLLLARIHRSVEAAPRRRPISMFAAAAGIVAVVAMGAVSMIAMQRASRIQDRAGTLGDAVQAMSVFGTRAFPLRDGGADGSELVGVTGPELKHLYLVGEHVPDPAPGNVYRLWLERGGDFFLAAEFVPEEGVVVLEVVVDPTGLDRLLVTEESASERTDTPGGVPRWSTSLSSEA